MKKSFDPKRWEKIRAKGRTRYVLVRGILGFGLIFAVAAALVEPLIGMAAWGRAYTPNVGVRLIQWPVAGIFFGLLMGIMTWAGGEREYEKYLEERARQAKRRRKKAKNKK